MQTKYEQFVIKMANVIKQSGINDCRVFVIAYITHIAFGQDPSLCVFPQNHMRNHLCTCFDEQKMVLMSRKWYLFQLSEKEDHYQRS